MRLDLLVDNEERNRALTFLRLAKIYNSRCRKVFVSMNLSCFIWPAKAEPKTRFRVTFTRNLMIRVNGNWGGFLSTRIYSSITKMIKLRGPLELHCWKDATARDRLRLRTRIRTAASRLVFTYAFFMLKKRETDGFGLFNQKKNLAHMFTYLFLQRNRNIKHCERIFSGKIKVQ